MPRLYQAGDEPVSGYKLRRSLGKGSLGEVWEASAPGGTQVAFKIIDLREKGSQREFRAIRRMKRIRHPNLVPILAWWLRDEEGKLAEADEADRVIDDPKYHPAELFISMGLGDKSLLDRFKECKSQGLPGIPPQELVSYIEDAARAIDHLNSPKHDLGNGPVALHHGDIKPQNLLIVGGAAQVSDSGLAKVLGQSSSSTSPALTLAFAPPEIMEDAKPASTTDQYALGLTYYYLRMGVLPFSKADQGTVIRETLDGRLDFGRVSSAERDVLERATARNPAKRFPSCVEFARELRRVVELLSSRAVGLAVESGHEIVPGYKLLRVLGRGAFGEMWEASFSGGGKAALKVVRDLDRNPTRLQQELRAMELMQRTQHPRLMELRGAWFLDRQGQTLSQESIGKPGGPVPAVLVLGFKLADRSLADRLEELKSQGKSGIPVGELLGYLRQAADGLDYLNAPRHMVGDQRVSLQHRNIKPENLLLLDGGLCISDFHMVKPVGMHQGSVEIHQDSVGFKFQYTPPEAMKGRITKTSDQFSLAITYCHLRTGELPWTQSNSAFEMMMQQMEGKVDLRAVPEAERRIVAKALSPNPEDRYPNCLAFIAALESVLGIAAPAQTQPQPPPETVKRPEAPPPPPSRPERRSEVKPPPSRHPDSLQPRRDTPAPFSLPGYQMVKRRGKGGFGEVWEAVGPDKKPVAMKLIELENRNAVKAEMRALEMMKKIRHPNILSIHGAGEHDKHLIIILELAERTLGDRLKELTAQGKKGLPVDELLDAMEDAAKGIDYLNEPRHELGDQRGQSIQHRDIKPHNLLVVGNTVKVGDFGLAKMLTKSVGGHSGAMSVAYAAPEFFNDQTSSSSDQYSLAVTYCQLRGGRTPFTGSEAKLMLGHMREPPDLTMLPEEAERRAVEKALAKNPKERYASCTEFVRALRKSLQPGSAKPQPPIPRQRKKANGALVGFLLFLMFCLIGALIFLFVLAFKAKQ